MGTPQWTAHESWALGRYERDGSPDRSFGSRGFTVTDIAGGPSQAPLSVFMRSDGTILVAGLADVPDWDAPRLELPNVPADSWIGRAIRQNQLAVVRYRADGRLDPAFGQRGRVIIDLKPEVGLPRGIVRARDGAILVAGGLTYSGKVYANLASYLFE